MAPIRTFTEEEIARINSMRASGSSWQAIGASFGCSYDKVRRAVEPAYAAKRTQQIRECEARRRDRGHYKSQGISHMASRNSVADDAMARLAEIPPDTRGLTARTFGDPIPGRSALDRRNA